MATNPFNITTLNADVPFCNRVRELEELVRYAKNGTNVVLFSPRRYGKTSLVYRVQSQLKHDDVVPIFADFYGVDSVEDVAARLARAVFTATHNNNSTWQSALKMIKSFRPVLKPDVDGGFSLSVEPASASLQGLDLLDDTMRSLGVFIAQNGKKIHICLDEFQEIVELRESAQIEAIMRTNIQNQQGAYLFVGSRRSLLLEMFNNSDRPFFQSAFNFELTALPREEYAQFIADQFARAGVECSIVLAELLVDTVSSHPYYTQKLAYVVYDSCGNVVTTAAIKRGIRKLVQIEKPVFEAKLQSLTIQQKKVVKALAIDPVKKPLSAQYLANHRLGSAGGVRNALNAMLQLDMVLKDEKSGIWTVSDPLFCQALQNSVSNLIDSGMKNN